MRMVNSFLENECLNESIGVLVFGYSGKKRGIGKAWKVTNIRRLT